jgi:hypothetical protein
MLGTDIAIDVDDNFIAALYQLLARFLQIFNIGELGNSFFDEV